MGPGQGLGQGPGQGPGSLPQVKAGVERPVGLSRGHGRRAAQASGPGQRHRASGFVIGCTPSEALAVGPELPTLRPRQASEEPRGRFQLLGKLRKRRRT